MRWLFARYAVPIYFAVTFLISWGGALLAIGGSGGMRGTTPTSDPRFAYALVGMLAGPSVTGVVMTALVFGRAGLRKYVTDSLFVAMVMHVSLTTSLLLLNPLGISGAELQVFSFAFAAAVWVVVVVVRAGSERARTGFASPRRPTVSA